MKSFKSVVMIRKPHTVIYDVMRDHLPQLAHEIADIDSVVERERCTMEDGATRVVNEWRVRYQVPQVIRSFLGPGELGWLDRGSWKDSICDWSIEPFFLAGQISCKGRTTFEPAMGGQGARITLEGDFDIKQGSLLGAASVIERPLLAFAESIVTTVLPKNLRGVVEAASSYADRLSQ